MKPLTNASRISQLLAAGSLCLLCGLRTPALHAQELRQWPIEMSVGQFQVHSDFQLLDKQSLASQLSDVTTQVKQLLDISGDKEPVHVVLFETEDEYRRYMQNYFPNLPARRALFIQDRGPGMLFAHWHEDIATDLRHEVTHALVNNSSGQLPLWIDEGIAEYFEVNPSQRFAASEHLDEVIARVEEGIVPSLGNLETIVAFDKFTNAHYRDSWSWVHYMLHRRDTTRQLLVRYLADCRSGARVLPLERQLQLTVGNVEQDYREHFSHFTATHSPQRVAAATTRKF